MMLPDLASRITADASRTPSQVPRRCTVMTASNWSTVIFFREASLVMPALLTNTSSRPNWPTVSGDDGLHVFFGGDVASQSETAEFLGGGLGGVAVEIDQNHACAVRVQARAISRPMP